MWTGAPFPAWEVNVEFLNFVLMLVIALLLLRKPEKERLAFRLLLASVLLMAALFLIATRTAILPGVNY
jgi:peptidoglycan/LPS O-acetylase OafA/YrhL